MSPRWGRAAATALATLLLLVAPARGQESLIEGEVAVHDQPWRLELPSVQAPTLLVIKGRADPGDLDLRLDGRSIGTLAGLGLVAGVPLESGGGAGAGPRRLELVPREGGGVLTSVTLEPAGILEVEVFAAAPREQLPAAVQVAALDGRDVPAFGRRPELGLWGRALLCPEGRGRLLVPADCSATLVAAATPFHIPERRQVRVSSGKRIGVRFLVEGPGVPPGARITHGPPPEVPGLDRVTLKILDRVQGIARRRSDLPGFAAAEAELDPWAFGKRLLEPGQLPPILIDVGWGSKLESPGCRPLRSVRLATGAWLHTNGPIIEVPPILRSGTTADPLSSVTASIRLDFDADIVPREVIVSTREGVILEHRLSKPETLRIPLVLPPRTRVLVSFDGHYFRSSPLAPRPLAWRTFLVP